MPLNSDNPNGAGFDADDTPPSLNYVIDVATPQQQSEIFQRLKSMARQTMNYRMMPDAQTLVLTDLDNQSEIVGWQGFGLIAGTPFAEKFSLHLNEKYRSFLLGLAIEHAFALHMQTLGVETALGRMSKKTNSQLLDWRVKTGICTEVMRSNLDSGWLSLCTKCELFGNRCTEQAFLKFHINKIVEFGNRRLGHASSTSFPRAIVLEPSIMRQPTSDRAKFKARWAG